MDLLAQLLLCLVSSVQQVVYLAIFELAELCFQRFTVNQSLNFLHVGTGLVLAMGTLFNQGDSFGGLGIFWRLLFLHLLLFFFGVAAFRLHRLKHTGWNQG